MNSFHPESQLEGTDSGNNSDNNQGKYIENLRVRDALDVVLHDFTEFQRHPHHVPSLNTEVREHNFGKVKGLGMRVRLAHEAVDAVSIALSPRTFSNKEREVICRLEEEVKSATEEIPQIVALSKLLSTLRKIRTTDE